MLNFEIRVFKTEALYSKLGKNKVTSHQYPVKLLAERTEWFIPYYNNDRKKDGLNHMTPVEYREANKKGTYLMVIKDNLWQVEIGVIYNICYLNRTSVKQCVTYTESVIVKVLPLVIH